MLSHLVLIQDELAHVSDALGSGLEIDLGQTLPRALSRRPSAACPPRREHQGLGAGRRGNGGLACSPLCERGTPCAADVDCVRTGGRKSLPTVMSRRFVFCSPCPHILCGDDLLVFVLLPYFRLQSTRFPVLLKYA